MKKEVMFFLSIFIFLVFIGAVFAVPAFNDLHLNIQTTYGNGSVQTGTFPFVFNISSTPDCATVVYSNSTTLTTDARGLISYYLNNVSLDFSQQYWLCYYRSGVLSDTVELSKTPSSFAASNVSLSGVSVDTNLNLGIFNITNANYINANYFVGNGSLLTGVAGANTSWNQSSLFGNFIFNITNNNFEIRNQSTANLFYINSTTGFIGINTSNPLALLSINGAVNITGGNLRIVSGGGFVAPNNFCFYGASTGGNIACLLSYNNNNNLVLGAVIGRTFITNSTLIGSVSFNPGSTLSVAGSLSVGANYSSLAAPTNGSIFEGNVGIGTSNPLTRLHLFSSSADALSLQTNNVAGSYAGLLFKTSTDTTSGFYKAGLFYTAPNPVDTNGRSNLLFGVTTSNDSTSANTSNLAGIFIQGTSGDVGINSTAPTNTLNVIGDINATNALYTNGLNVTAYLTNGTFSSTGDNTSFNQSLILGGILINLTNQNFEIRNTSTSNLFFVNGTTGFVGINTSNPTTVLDIGGNLSLEANSTIGIKRNDGVIAGTIRLSGDGVGLLIKQGGGGSYINFATNSQQNATRITDSGAFGINTTTPTNTLNVVGDINATTSLYTNGLNITNLTGYFTNNTFYPYSNPYSYYNSTSLPSSATNGSSVFFNNLNTTGLLNISNFAFSNSTNFWINISTTSASVPLSSFFTIGKGKGIDEFNLSGIEFGNSTSGFLGVNTSSPQNTLNVIGQINLTNGSTNATGFYLNNLNQIGIGASNPQGILDILIAANPGVIIESNSSGSGTPTARINLVDTFSTNVSSAFSWAIDNKGTAFRISSQPNISATSSTKILINGTTGNVGINNTNPSSSFTLTGSIGLPKFCSSGSDCGVGGSCASNICTAGSATNSFVANWTGYVGINTTSIPQNALDVNGNANISKTLFGNLVNITTGNFTLNSQTLTNIFFANATNGYVGINTTTPQNTLNVVGNANITGNTNITGTLYSGNNLTISNGTGSCTLFIGPAGACPVGSTAFTLTGATVRLCGSCT